MIFFKKRFLRLVAPWVTWTIIYTAITIYTQQIYAFPKIARTFITQLEAFWFLPMIVGLYLLTPAIRIFVQSAKKRDIWLVIFLWFLVVSFLPFVDNSLAFPRQVDDSLLRQIVNYFGYFLLGYVLTDVKFYKSWILPCLFIFLGIFWTIFSVYNSSLYKGIMIKDLYTYISPGIVWLAIGIFMLIFKISKKKGNVVNKTGGKIIILLSTSALAIYFIHALVQRIFIIFFGTASLLPDIPFANFINGAILFATSFFILFILYQVPFVKRLIA